MPEAAERCGERSVVLDVAFGRRLVRLAVFAAALVGSCSGCGATALLSQWCSSLPDFGRKLRGFGGEPWPAPTRPRCRHAELGAGPRGSAGAATLRCWRRPLHV